MTRPLQNASEALLREEAIRVKSKLDRLNDCTIHHERELEARDGQMRSLMLDDMAEMFQPIDFVTLVQNATAEAREKLRDRLDEIEDELQQREWDKQDAVDDNKDIVMLRRHPERAVS